MANPTGGSLRSNLGSVLGRTWQELIVILATVEANEGSYTAENFTTLTEALDSARDLVNDAALANESTSNPG